MALPEIVIGSKLDAKGFKQAESAMETLGKSVKKLAIAFGVTFSAQKIAAFGKTSVKAFLDDEKAAKALTKSLNNMGLAFQDSRIKAYVSSLEAATGVSDDLLRPALQGLLSTTGSVTKSQELLKLAIDVAAGSGEKLTTVASDLSMAFVGNTKGLKKYNLGLTQSQLQTMRFSDIQDKLNQQFSGQNAAYLDTYAGKLSLVQVAYDNMQETIGKGLIDSFSLLAGESGIGGATTAMEQFGVAASETLLGVAAILKKITPTGVAGEPGFWHDLYIAFGGQIIEDIRKIGRSTAAQALPGAPGVISGKSLGGAAYTAAQNKANEAAIKQQQMLKKIEDERIKNQQKILANAKKAAAEAQKKLVLDKAAAFLKQGENLFDLERIQLAAAALGKQTEEDKVRIRLKQELLDLEDAINDGNVQAAAKLAQSITNDAQLLGQLRGDMVKLGDVPDPFAEWLLTLQAIAAQLAALANYVPPIVNSIGIGMGGFNAGSARMGESAGNAAAGLPANSLTNSMGFGDEHLGALARQGAVQNINVVVNNAGSTITERDLVSSITQGIYNNQASGIPINYSTVY
jgi:hypothetical protein